MDIKEIVIEYLNAHGYGGLCNPDAECGCDIDDLAPCGDCCNIVECMPAYKVEGRCKTCDHPCDGYDPDGPGICYTTQKPEGATVEEGEGGEDEWIGEHLKEDYAVCEAMGLQNGLNLTKWPEDKMDRHLAQLEMITQYTQRVMDEIETHVCAHPAPPSEKALREACQWIAENDPEGMFGRRASQVLLVREAPKAESPKPAEDARELNANEKDIEEVLRAVEEGVCVGIEEPMLSTIVKAYRAKQIHDTNLLDKAAERAVEWTHDNQYTEDDNGDPCDPAVLIDDDALRAAVRGEEE